MKSPSGPSAGCAGSADSASSNRQEIGVVYYALPGFLDALPEQIEALSSFASVHVILEVTPVAWRNNSLGLPDFRLAPGLHDVRNALQKALAPRVMSRLENAKSIVAAVYGPGVKSLWSTGRMLVRHVHSLKPDIVHLDEASPRACILLFTLSMPVVASVHEPTVPGGWKSMVGVALAKRLVFRMASALILMSEQGSRRLHELRPSLDAKVFTTMRGPYFLFRDSLDNAPRGAASRDGLHALFFGFMTPRKGIDVFVRAVRLASGELDHVHAIAAGCPCEGIVPPSSESLRRGGSLRVIPKRLTNEELAAFLDWADVVVLPYLEATVSGVVLSAYGSGRPVLVSDIPALRAQTIDQWTGRVVPVGDATHLAKVLVSTDFGALAERLAVATREQRLTCLSWADYTRVTQRAYESLLGQGKAKSLGLLAAPRFFSRASKGV
jgi:glycosyltransferase involved in cell wall biosynthesis